MSIFVVVEVGKSVLFPERMALCLVNYRKTNNFLISRKEANTGKYMFTILAIL